MRECNDGTEAMSPVPRLSDLSPDDPVEHQRAQWRLASSRRRQRESTGQRVFHLTLPEVLVIGGLMATNPGRIDFTDHQECEVLLANLIAEHLRSVMHDCQDEALRVDIGRLLQGFDK